MPPPSIQHFSPLRKGRAAENKLYVHVTLACVKTTLYYRQMDEDYLSLYTCIYFIYIHMFYVCIYIYIDRLYIYTNFNLVHCRSVLYSPSLFLFSFFFFFFILYTAYKSQIAFVFNRLKGFGPLHIIYLTKLYYLCIYVYRGAYTCFS
jgi:hypothetical protein